jgi:hypothetical protein
VRATQRSIGGGEEGVRRHERPRVVAHAHEHLHRPWRAREGCDGDDVLAVEDQPVFGEGLGDAVHVLHFAAAPRELEIALLVDVDAVASEVLRRVAGDVGRAQHHAHAATGGADTDGADAHARLEGLVRPDEAEVAHGAAQLLGDPLPLIERAARQQHAELVAAEPRQGVRPAQPRL